MSRYVPCMVKYYQYYCIYISFCIHLQRVIYYICLTKFYFYVKR